MTEIRCKKCNRLLMKAENLFAEIQCPKCHYRNLIQFDEKSFLIQLDGDKFGTIPKLPVISAMYLADPTPDNFAKDVDDAIFKALAK